jgi:CheY-like chemotaxis protein
MHSYAPSKHRLTTHRDVVAAPRKPLILVVDGQDLSRGALAVLLSTLGYASVEAANGREALATLAGGVRPDLILLDLMMPVMDGWEFMKQQRRDWRFCTIPTIVITAVASHDPRCLEMPVVRFLPKPYTPEQLMAAIEAEVSPPLLRSTSKPVRDRRD